MSADSRQSPRTAAVPQAAEQEVRHGPKRVQNCILLKRLVHAPASAALLLLTNGQQKNAL